MLVITTGVGLGSIIPVTAAVNWWFSRRRNAAMGLAMAGVGMGAFWSPVVAWGITTHSWRATAVAVGVLLLVAGFPLSRVLRPRRDRPRQDSQQGVSTRTRDATESTAGPDFTLRQALRTRAFWLIPLVHAASMFTTYAVNVHGIPHLADVGLSLQTAGWVMATYGFSEVLMRVFGSPIGDRVNKRYAIWAYCSIQSLALVVLALARSAPAAFLFAVLFAIGHGGRGPLLVAIRGEYFGRRHFGTILGIGNLITSVPGIITPVLLGALFDIQGTYVPGFLSMAALTFARAFLILWAVRPTLPRTPVPQPSAH